MNPTPAIATPVRTLQPGEPYHWLGTPHPLQFVADAPAPVLLEDDADPDAPLLVAKRHATRETIIDWYARRGADYATRVIRAFAHRARMRPRPVHILDFLPDDELVAHDRGTIAAHWATFQLPCDLVELLLARELARPTPASISSGPTWCMVLDDHMPDWQRRDLAAAESVWRGEVDGTLVPPIPDITQPVPRPATYDEFLELARAGILIDLADRPLTANRCRWCDGDHVSGTVCAVSLACPSLECAAPPGGRYCFRPSGHYATELHAPRVEAAQLAVEARAAAGDSYVPAPWAQPIQTELFSLEEA